MREEAGRRATRRERYWLKAPNTDPTLAGCHLEVSADPFQEERFVRSRADFFFRTLDTGVRQKEISGIEFKRKTTVRLRNHSYSSPKKSLSVIHRLKLTP